MLLLRGTDLDLLISIINTADMISVAAGKIICSPIVCALPHFAINLKTLYEAMRLLQYHNLLFEQTLAISYAGQNFLSFFRMLKLSNWPCLDVF